MKLLQEIDITPFEMLKLLTFSDKSKEFSDLYNRIADRKDWIDKFNQFMNETFYKASYAGEVASFIRCCDWDADNFFS